MRVLILLVGIVLAAHAQTVGAGMQGTVLDPSGAAVVGAAVDILHVETGDPRRLVTNSAGHWEDPVLSPGDYEIKVSAPGFQTVLRKGLHLAVGQDAVVDFHLEIGRNDT